MDRKQMSEALIHAFQTMGDLAEISGGNGGSIIIDGTDATAVEAYAIVANSATVINVITGEKADGTAVNFAAAPYNWVTLPAGTFMKVPKGWRILSIDLTSGSLSVYIY